MTLFRFRQATGLLGVSDDGLLGVSDDGLLGVSDDTVHRWAAGASS